MRIQILYFQSLRKLLALDRESLELPGSPRISDLKKALATRHPELKSLLPSLLFAINQTHVGDSAALNEGDEVAVMPPFSGG